MLIDAFLRRESSCESPFSAASGAGHRSSSPWGRVGPDQEVVPGSLEHAAAALRPPFLASSFLDALSLLVQMVGVMFPRETTAAVRQAAQRSRESAAMLAWMLQPVAGAVLAGDLLGPLQGPQLRPRDASDRDLSFDQRS